MAPKPKNITFKGTIPAIHPSFCDWTRFSTIMAPNVRVDDGVPAGMPLPFMPSGVLLNTTRRYLQDNNIKTRHFIGASKYQKVAHDEIVGWHQVGVLQYQFTDSTMSIPSGEVRTHTNNKFWYKKINGSWKIMFERETFHEKKTVVTKDEDKDPDETEDEFDPDETDDEFDPDETEDDDEFDPDANQADDEEDENDWDWKYDSDDDKYAQYAKKK
ncbi:hypothetical protein DV738_g3414, partial [Chaetothyriales sp. CBS 135597]